MTKAQIWKVATAIYKADDSNYEKGVDFSRLSPNAKSGYQKMAKAAITTLSSDERHGPK